MTAPDAIERAARAMYVHDYGPDPDPWEAVGDYEREEYRVVARVALDAAALTACDTCGGSGVLGDDDCPGGCDRGGKALDAAGVGAVRLVPLPQVSDR